MDAPGIRETPPPWPAEPAGLAERLKAFDVQPFLRSSDGFAVHLDVFVDGERVSVPEGIGQGSDVSSPISSMSSAGVVDFQVAEGQPNRYTLGQLFGVWGVRFTANQIGDMCNRGDSVLSVHVNGKTNVGDLPNIPMGPSDEHAEIVVAFGAGAELPHPIPSSYDSWPGGAG